MVNELNLSNRVYQKMDVVVEIFAHRVSSNLVFFAETETTNYKTILISI